MTTLDAHQLSLGYHHHSIVHQVDLEIPDGEVTMVVGANGSGKSTLLRGLSRLLKPQSGTALLDGQSIHTLPAKEVARKLGLLPQSPTAPDGITVRDLVSRGRFPHQNLFRTVTATDRAAIDDALHATNMTEFSERLVSELSGGQRQRAWIAMALAQQTEVLLLDEPTTFLDVSHQIDVLEVVQRLNRERGTTVVIVLHDLNLAARYADHLVALKQGQIVAEGSPAEILDAPLLKEAFGLEARVIPDPFTRTPLVVPLADAASAVTPVEDVMHSLAMRTQVAAVQELSPTFLRLTLAGPDLHLFGVGGHPLDLRIKVCVPGQDGVEALNNLRPGAMITEDYRTDWYKQWLQQPEPQRGVLRTYSVREFRPHLHPGNLTDFPELDLDVVRHQGGKASDFLQEVRVDDAVTILGPNGRLAGPEWGGIAFRPGVARRVLLAGDETAVPAIMSVLESLPASFSGHALIEVPDRADIQSVMTRSSVEVRWLVRGKGPSGSVLEPEVRGVDVPLHDGASRTELEDVDVDSTLLWEESAATDHQFYAWLAGEAGVIKTLRRYLVTELGLDRTQVSFMGYWRIGRAEA